MKVMSWVHFACYIIKNNESKRSSWSAWPMERENWMWHADLNGKWLHPSSDATVQGIKEDCPHTTPVDSELKNITMPNRASHVAGHLHCPPDP